MGSNFINVACDLVNNIIYDNCQKIVFHNDTLSLEVLFIQRM